MLTIHSARMPSLHFTCALLTVLVACMHLCGMCVYVCGEDAWMGMSPMSMDGIPIHSHAQMSHSHRMRHINQRHHATLWQGHTHTTHESVHDPARSSSQLFCAHASQCGISSHATLLHNVLQHPDLTVYAMHHIMLPFVKRHVESMMADGCKLTFISQNTLTLMHDADAHTDHAQHQKAYMGAYIG